MIEEELSFFTRWKIVVEDDGSIDCIQEIQIKGMSEIMTNHFSISAITPFSFTMLMDSHALGKMEGAGLIREGVIGWEFRVKDSGFEGFEHYTKLSDDSYFMQGEFATADQLRTTLQGKIWKQVAPVLEGKEDPFLKGEK